MATPDKEWFTLQELVEMWGIGYNKVRSAVFTLRNLGQIRVRENPQDTRITEVYRDSLATIKQGVGLG